jgi:hypothetical protein
VGEVRYSVVRLFLKKRRITPASASIDAQPGKAILEVWGKLLKYVE